MKTEINEAVLFTVIMAAVIFFCRIFPFIFFGRKTPYLKTNNSGTDRIKTSILAFVEKIVPPLAMTVLAFNALTAPIYENIRQGIPVQSLVVLAAATLTVLIHLWRRNPMLSIFGGTAVYMVLERLLG